MRGCAPRAPLIPLLMRKKNNSQKAGLRRRDPQFSARAVAMISLLSLAVPGCYLAVLGLAKVWNAAGHLAVTRPRLRPVLLFQSGRNPCLWLRGRGRRIR